MEKHQTILDKAFRERKWEVQLIFFNGYYFNRNRRKERGREGGRQGWMEGGRGIVIIKDVLIQRVEFFLSDDVHSRSMELRRKCNKFCAFLLFVTHK